MVAEVYVTRSHWRSAAGAALVAAGLMVNGSGAMAVADTGSSASSDAGGAGTASPSSHQNDPIGSLSKAVRDTIHGTTGALNPGNLVRPNPTVGSTGTSIIAVPQMLADAIRVQSPITGLSIPRPDPAAPILDPAAAAPITTKNGSPTARNGVSDAVTSLNTMLSSTTNQVEQATNAVVVPVTAAANAGVQSVLVPVGAGIAAATAPLPAVLSSIQAILTSTANAVEPVTQLPTDLAGLFGITGVTPVSTPVRTDSHWATPATLSTPLSTERPPAVSSGAASATADVADPVSTPQMSVRLTSAIAEASAANASARTAPVSGMPEGLQKFFRSYGALVAAASLTALIAAALPGIAALLIPTAAGVGMGYRQAKAGSTLRESGIARFAGGGPVGIVRSGSLVSLRPPALRIARTSRPRAGATKDAHLAA